MVDIINNVGNVPKLNIELGSTKYTEKTTVALDFSWYAPFKHYGDLVITGFVYAMYLWRLFIKLPGIISGSSGGIEALSNYTGSRSDFDFWRDRWGGHT